MIKHKPMSVIAQRGVGKCKRINTKVAFFCSIRTAQNSHVGGYVTLNAYILKCIELYTQRST